MKKICILLLVAILTALVSACAPTTSSTPSEPSLPTALSSGSESEDASPLPPSCQHLFESWEQILAPTCNSEGTMRSICLLCGYPEEKALPKTEFHAFTDNGKCSYCDAEMKEGFLFEENGNGESYAFSYTGKEESIVVPLFYSGYPVTSIKQISATVKEISLPQGIVEIGPYAFMNCKELSSIILPEGLTIVGMDAFSGCGKLQSVLLPSTLQFIGANAFAGAATEGLTIRYNGKETLWQAVDKDPSFMGDTANYTLIFEE